MDGEKTPFGHLLKRRYLLGLSPPYQVAGFALSQPPPKKRYIF